MKRAPFVIADDLADLLAVLNRLRGEEAGRREPVREIGGILRRPGTVEQPPEASKEHLRPSLHDQRQAIGRGRKSCAVEVLSEIQHRLLAVLVRGTHGEGALDLTGEPAALAAALTDDEEVIGLPAQVVGLETHLHHARVDQDRWDPPDQQLRKPVSIDIPLEERTGAAGGERAGYDRARHRD